MHQLGQIHVPFFDACQQTKPGVKRKPHDTQVTVGDNTLTEELEVINSTEAESPLKFTAALHTYFRISDISQTHVQGLSGLQYLDNMQNRQEGTDEAQVISIAGEIDRIYVKAPDHLKVKLIIFCHASDLYKSAALHTCTLTAAEAEERELVTPFCLCELRCRVPSFHMGQCHHRHDRNT